MRFTFHGAEHAGHAIRTSPAASRGILPSPVHLAVATAKRIDDLPDVPTLKEAGADVEAVLWNGILVPKGTPPAIVKKLEGEFMRIAKLPDVIARLKPLGIHTFGNSSDDFAKIVSSEIARWGAVAKAANFKIEQ